jgi:hypothetical protein
LKHERSSGLTVFVIWEPILFSDWGRPTRAVLARISDSRALQYWDKDHAVAQQLDTQLSARQPSCCRRNGVLWDVVALYPNGAQWGGLEPVYIDGPVAKVKARIASEISNLGR